MKIAKIIAVSAIAGTLALPAIAQSDAAPQMDAQELILSTQSMTDGSTLVMLIIIALFVAVLTANTNSYMLDAR